MDTLAAIAVDSIVYASWLFLVSVGLTLIYGVMKLLNVAHGSLYALGAYLTAWSVGLYTNGSIDTDIGVYFIILLSALVIGLFFGLIIERGLLRHMYGLDEIVIVLATYAVFLILEDFMKLIFGVESYLPYQPRYFFGTIEIYGLVYVVYDLCIVLLSIIIGLLLWLGIYFTRHGKLLTSVISDSEISSAIGINVSKYFMVTFMIGATLGALGGAVTAPMISVVPGLGVEVIVLAFAVVVTGGLGSIGGAAIGSLIVGFGRTSAVFLMPELELFVVFFVMAIVLAFRPEGMFGKKIMRKI